MDKEEMRRRLESAPRRPKEEIFKEMVERMQETLGLGPAEAAQAANNLIRLCSAIVYGELAQKQKEEEEAVKAANPLK